MCLDQITKKYKQPNQKIVHGWKIVKNDNQGRYRPLWFWENKYIFTTNFIKNDNGVYNQEIQIGLFPIKDKTYPKGFHVYLNKRHAKKILKRMEKATMWPPPGRSSFRLTLIPVELKNLTCKGKEYGMVPKGVVNVMVGQEVRVLEEKK